jgi:hypothetical protein
LRLALLELGAVLPLRPLLLRLRLFLPLRPFGLLLLLLRTVLALGAGFARLTVLVPALPVARLSHRRGGHQ